MLKKISLAVLGLTVNSLALAGSMGPVCLPGNVTVPCVENHWEFGIQALYLSPSFETQNAFTFASIIADALPIVQVPANGLVDPLHQINNKNWNWGSLLQGAYHFNTGNDITINWLHYNNSKIDNWNTALALPLNVQPITVAPVPVVLDVDTAFTFYGVNRFDQVNLELGQLANFGQNDKLRFFGGLQYAHVQADAQNCLGINVSRKIQESTVTILQTNLGSFNNSDFKGIGPVAGIDYAYYLTHGFSLTANGSGSLIYGPSRIEAGIVDPSGTVVIAGASNRQDTIVPTLQGEFGLNYAYNMAQGQLNLQVGYLALNYFDALQTQPLALLGAITTNDYSLYGPYAGISFVGNV